MLLMMDGGNENNGGGESIANRMIRAADWPIGRTDLRGQWLGPYKQHSHTTQTIFSRLWIGFTEILMGSLVVRQTTGIWETKRNREQ